MSLGQCGSMNAPLKFLGDRLVALAAGLGHIELEDRRFRIFRVENLMRAVAVGTHGGLFGSAGNRVSMDAGLVGGNHLRALAAVGHDELLAVAGAASRGDIHMTHARFWIRRRQQFVRTAVTVCAGRGVAIPALHGFGMMAAIVGRLLIGMAGGATDLLGSRFVRGAFYVGVAVHATEHAAMDGILESLGVDVQADRLAVYFVTQGSVAMAGEALVNGGFRGICFRSCREGSGS